MVRKTQLILPILRVRPLIERVSCDSTHLVAMQPSSPPEQLAAQRPIFAIPRIEPGCSKPRSQTCSSSSISEGPEMRIPRLTGRGIPTDRENEPLLRERIGINSETQLPQFLYRLLTQFVSQPLGLCQMCLECSLVGCSRTCGTTNEISWSHRNSSNPNRPAVPGRICLSYARSGIVSRCPISLRGEVGERSKAAVLKT